MPRIPGSAALLALLALGTVAPAASAQFVYSIEASGTTVSYANAMAASGVALTPQVKLELPRSSLVANGTLAMFDGGRWSAQGLVSASLFTGTARGLRGELAATASGIAYNDNGRSAFLVSEGRLHLASEEHGVWAGAGFGGTGTSDAGSPLVLLDAGAWMRVGGATITASFTQSRFRSHETTLFSAPFATGIPLQITLPESQPVVRRRVLDDATATLHLEHSVLELDASVGARLPSVSDHAQQWAAVIAALRVSRDVAVVASGGRYPESLVQGFPNVRFASLGLRFTPRARAPRTEAVTMPTAPDVARAVDFAVLPDSGTRHAIRVIAPGARLVEVMGDFTGWSPLPLDHVSADAWEARLTMPPGTYRVSVRIDGTEWTAPPGIPARVDEFGGESGVVVVP